MAWELIELCLLCLGLAMSVVSMKYVSHGCLMCYAHLRHCWTSTLERQSVTGKTLDKSVVKPESLQAMAKVCVPTAGAPGVACWFPMTLLAMSLMSQQACKSKPRKKIAKVRRPPVHQPPSSVLSSSPEIPLCLLDLRAEEDPVKQAFWEACHRSLDYFASLAAIPRTGFSQQPLRV